MAHQGRHGRGQSQHAQTSRQVISDASIDKVITEGDPMELITQAEKLGKSLKEEGLKTASVRNFFGMVRQMQSLELSRKEMQEEQSQLSEKTYRDLLLMIPKLKYQAQRGLPGVKTLADSLEPAIRKIGREPQAFENFVDFFEAILAYHKAEGGSE